MQIGNDSGGAEVYGVGLLRITNRKGSLNMGSYMLQVSYTQTAMASLSKKPQDRTDVVGKAIANLGGSLKSIWLSFGDYDVVGIMEMPDNVSAAALAIALSAGGACKSIKTTPLLTVAEGMAAMKLSSKSGYKAVGS
jgi:uncharacterized protein with GYD domain